MRTRLARICLLASACLLLTPTLADAQGKKPAAAAKADPKKDPKADPKKDPNAKPKEVALEDEGDSGPVTAGQMTEEAAQAKRLFDGERWAEAAVILKRVFDGETGDDEG